MLCSHSEYGVVVSQRDTVLVTEAVGIGVVMQRVLSTCSDPIRNTGFSLINVTWAGIRDGRHQRHHATSIAYTMGFRS